MKPWYEITNRINQAIDVELHDEIGLGGITAADFIKELQSQGITSYKSLANALNVRGIPTANKRQWHGTTVKNIIKRSM